MPVPMRPASADGTLPSWLAVALYCFLGAVPIVAAFAELVRWGLSGTGIYYFLSIAGAAAVYLALGVVLWTGSERLGRRLVSYPHVDPTGAPGDASELQAMAFSVAGVVFIVLGLPRLIFVLHAWIAPADSRVIRPLDGAQLIEPGVRVLAGVALFLGGKGLARLWRKLRREDLADSQQT